MHRLAVPLITAAVAALLALAPGASAAKTTQFAGKTSSGQSITFTVKGNRVHDLTSGIAVTCLPIQGGGKPMTGVEVFGFEGSVPYLPHAQWSFMAKPGFHYNEVTMKHELWLDGRGARAVSGRIRMQYSFLVPKYPIGTFSVFSCEGFGKFSAKAKR